MFIYECKELFLPTKKSISRNCQGIKLATTILLIVSTMMPKWKLIFGGLEYKITIKICKYINRDYKLNVVIDVYNASTWEVKAEGLGVQG